MANTPQPPSPVRAHGTITDGCSQDETDTCMVMDVSPPAVAETSECHDYYSDNGKPYPLPLWGSCMWNARRDFHRLTPVHVSWLSVPQTSGISECADHLLSQGYNGFASIGHPSVPCITLHPSPPTTYDDRLEAWPNSEYQVTSIKPPGRSR